MRRQWRLDVFSVVELYGIFIRSMLRIVIEIQMRRQESAYSRFTDAAAKIVGIIFQLLDPRYGADIFAKRFALNERVQLFERRWKALRLSIGVVRANLSAVFNTEAIV